MIIAIVLGSCVYKILAGPLVISSEKVCVCVYGLLYVPVCACIIGGNGGCILCW